MWHKLEQIVSLHLQPVWIIDFNFIVMMVHDSDLVYYNNGVWFCYYNNGVWFWSRLLHVCKMANYVLILLQSVLAKLCHTCSDKYKQNLSSSPMTPTNNSTEVKVYELCICVHMTKTITYIGKPPTMFIEINSWKCYAWKLGNHQWRMYWSCTMHIQYLSQPSGWVNTVKKIRRCNETQGKNNTKFNKVNVSL